MTSFSRPGAIPTSSAPAHSRRSGAKSRGTGVRGAGARFSPLLLPLLLALVLAGLPGQAGAVSEEDKANQLNEREGGPIFVPLPAFVVVVVNQHRVSRQVIVAVSLELFPGKRRAEVDEKSRQLYDAFLKDLYAILEQHASEGDRFGTEVVKARLLARAEKMLGSGVVRSVLIKAAYERPMRY